MEIAVCVRNRLKVWSVSCLFVAAFSACAGTDHGRDVEIEAGDVLRRASEETSARLAVRITDEENRTSIDLSGIQSLQEPRAWLKGSFTIGEVRHRAEFRVLNANEMYTLVPNGEIDGNDSNGMTWELVDLDDAPEGYPSLLPAPMIDGLDLTTSLLEGASVVRGDGVSDVHGRAVWSYVLAFEPRDGFTVRSASVLVDDEGRLAGLEWSGSSEAGPILTVSLDFWDYGVTVDVPKPDLEVPEAAE